MFDDQLSLDLQLVAIIQKFNMNLRNYCKIGNKLSHELK